MSYQDKLKSSQGSGNAAPSLTIAHRIDIKEVEGRAQFTTYNKDTKKYDDVIFLAPEEVAKLAREAATNKYYFGGCDPQRLNQLMAQYPAQAAGAVQAVPQAAPPPVAQPQGQYQQMGAFQPVGARPQQTGMAQPAAMAAPQAANPLGWPT